MNFKTTSILFALLVAVGAYVFLTRDKGVDTSTEKPAPKKLLSIAAADVQTITVTPADGTPFAFARDGMNWKMTRPIESPAESAIVEALVLDISNLVSVNSADVSEGTGLKTPRYVIELTARDGKATAFNVGERSGVGDLLYVQLKGNPKADMVAAGLEQQIDRPVDDFRQKKLVRIGMPEIKYVSIDRPGGKLELVKNGATWQVTAPQPMPADSAAVTDMLVAINNLRSEEFVDGANPSSPMYGLTEGAKTITIAKAPPTTMPTSMSAAMPTTQPAPIVISIGRPDTLLEKNFFATVNGSNVVVKLPKESLAFLDKKPIEFRDKAVADIEPKSVNKLTVTITHPATTRPTTKPAEKESHAVTRRPPKPAATQPATTQPSTMPIERPPSVWMSEAGPANDALVERILAELHPLHSEKYVESVPTEGTTINVHLDTGGGGVWTAGVTDIQIVDPADGKSSPVATYNGLHFEIERSIVEDLQSDFTKPSARPRPADMGPSFEPSPGVEP